MTDPEACKDCGGSGEKRVHHGIVILRCPSCMPGADVCTRIVRNCGGCMLYGQSEGQYCRHEDAYTGDPYNCSVKDFGGPDHLPSDCPLRARTYQLDVSACEKEGR